MTQIEINSKSLFRTHFICWRILGNLPTKSNRKLYIFYSIVVNIAITIGYPLHLMIGLFRSTTLSDIIMNLAINLTCFVCSIKTFVIWTKFKNVRKIGEIIERQDKRIVFPDEVKYYKDTVRPSVLLTMRMFYFLCSGTAISSESAVIANGLMGHWRLMYPAYFPFDPFATSLNYFAAHMYQFCGISFQILQNLVNDTFCGMHLAFLSGQLQLLSMRVAKIGHDPQKSLDDNNRELLDCIQRHKDLLEYRTKLEELVSLYMFFQIIFAGVNMCVVVVFIMLFVRDPATLSYYFIYFMGMVLEILPSCYFGTVMESEFQNLSYALFRSNWVEQDLTFKKNLRIFVEQANKELHVLAWIFYINLSAFLAACKNAYSLFAVVMSVK